MAGWVKIGQVQVEQGVYEAYIAELIAEYDCGRKLAEMQAEMLRLPLDSSRRR